MAEEAIDGDTVCNRDSFEAASMGVGVDVTAVDTIAKMSIEMAFCAVRPTVHHAPPLLLRWASVFSTILRSPPTMRKRVDTGASLSSTLTSITTTGPRRSFSRMERFCASRPIKTPPIQEREEERTAGERTTFNVPLSPGSGDEAILPIYEEELPRALEAFAPDLLLVYAGYDLHRDDPLVHLNVSTEGVRGIVRAILQSCDAPAIFMLEGVYDIFKRSKRACP